MADSLPAVLSPTPGTSVRVVESPVETAAPAAERQPAPSPLAGVASPMLAISLLAAMHFLVDTAAGTINPLWQGFEDRLQLQRGGLLWVYVCWQAASSFSQLLFAWWADRAPQPWLIWAGPCVGAACMGLTGLAPNSFVLAALLVCAGLGIAAFHPEGAAAAGAVAPLQRSRMMSIFALWGYLGQSLGPYMSARITTDYGFGALVWWGLCGLAALAVLLTQRRYVPIPPLRHASRQQVSARETSWRDWALLLSVGTLRIIPSIGVPLVIAYWLSSPEFIGAVQSSFMIGVGAGSILCALLIRPKWERGLIWSQPLLAAPCLIAIPLVPQAWLATVVAVTGFMLGIALPVFISFGQQMLPHHPRAASSVTMGVSWGVAGGIAAAALWGMTALDQRPQTFYVLAAFSIAAGLLSLRLPHIAECEK
ncbi:MAG: MFS transporter [Planctomycetaceae bacterium]|nr:MFS transporter [Planctomycetaceae bacterium]